MDNGDKKISIVVVEDHHVTMHGLVSWLEQTGQFQIKGKCGTKDALVSLISEVKPDIVLLDLHMPGKFSLEEVIRVVTAKGARIVVFTAENRSFYVKLALKLGASAFLLKSESFFKLAEVIRAVNEGDSSIVSQGLLDEDITISQAEEEILSMLSGGFKYDDIARLRETSPETVRKQCNRLQAKIGLGSREELIAWAVRNGYGD
ncbi:MAG: response regulator transcription factor [Cyanobacteria bacterium]|nr:response regulator transcription factor [Cyanobacteriota bacterium]